MGTDHLPSLISARVSALPGILPVNVVKKNDGSRGEGVNDFAEVIDIVLARVASVMKEKIYFVEGFEIDGPQCPATEHLVRTVRTDPAQSGGLRSEKTSSRRRCVFS
jgi:hypothetical protein